MTMSHLGEDPARKTEMEWMEENDLVHSNPLSSVGIQIFSPLLWKRKRKKRKAGQSGVAKVFF